MIKNILKAIAGYLPFKAVLPLGQSFSPQRRLALWVIVLLGLTASSCLKSKDEDYDPTRINDVSIRTTFESEYTLNVGDTLRLKADVDQTKPTAQLAYKWYYYSKATSSAPRVEIGNQAELDYPIITMPQGVYVLTVEVKDMASGVSTFKSTGLTIKRSTSEGWLMLTNTQGKPNFSIVTPQNELYRNVLMPSAEYPNLGTPEKLFVLNTPEANVQPIAFRTSDNMYFINHDTFEINNTIADAFLSPAGSRIMSFFGDLYAQNYFTIDERGKVYWLRRGLPANVNKNFPTGFSVPLGGSYEAAQTILPSSSSNPVQAFFFDRAGKRFVCQPAATASRDNMFPVRTLANAGLDKTKWDTDNFTDEMVFGGHGNSALNYIVGKNVSGYTLYTLNDIVYGAVVYPAVTEPQKLTALGQNSDIHLFAFSGKLPLFYYIDGQSLYLYNISERKSTLLYSFPEAEKPVDMKMLRETMGVTLPLANSQFAVAVNRGAEGILYTFNISNTGMLEGNSYFKRYEGIPFIVSLSYKNKP